ncbi:MAG: hypothetical protein Ct9H300mP19_02930 [Dehalococcoidia bacterium]|nr:MAG: hypothetical protein Ct9H300mP19_02930 [Dehalococcoidia bacterium]
MVNGACMAQFERLLNTSLHGAQWNRRARRASSQDLPRLGFVSNIADLYRLHNRRDELLKVDKMGETRWTICCKPSKPRDPIATSLLFALGISGVGSERLSGLHTDSVT